MNNSFINKNKLIEKLSKDTGIDYYQAHMATKTIINVMSKALEDNRRIEVRGFGAFKVREHKNKTVRNPKTGETINDKNAYQIHFKAGQTLRTNLLKKAI